MFTYFFMIFEVHHTTFRYNVFLKEYTNLSPRLVSGSGRYKTNEKDKEERELKKIQIII